jgi:hypothetical protein
MYEISFRGTPPSARALAFVRQRCLPSASRQDGLHYRVTVEPSAGGGSFAVRVCAHSAGQQQEASAAHVDVIRALEQAFGGV